MTKGSHTRESGNPAISPHQVSRLRILLLAWPIVLSNLSTPLLGLVDTAVIGNLGSAHLIGAVAIGGMIFSFLFWGFGFLRMGTTGLVAQALGASNNSEIRSAFYRALLTGLVVGLLLILFQSAIASLSLNLFTASEEVEKVANEYFEIRIWGAPFNLCNLAIIGFLLGTQNTRALLFVQLFLNGLNIALDILFVVVFNWGVAGVALATVIAEVFALGLGCIFVFRVLKQYPGTRITITQLLNWSKLKRLLSLNGDIMIRTLCLIFAFAWFTNQGAKSGDVILATNAILMQFVTFSAFFLDGFALATESLVGIFTGSGDDKKLKASINYSFEWSLLTSVLLSLCFLLCGDYVIGYLTNVESIIQASTKFMIWVILVPLISFSSYLLDGIFIGATRTAEMRNAMLVSLGLYLGSWYLLSDSFGNHGLWASLMSYFIFRALTLAYYLPRLYEKGNSL